MPVNDNLGLEPRQPSITVKLESNGRTPHGSSAFWYFPPRPVILSSRRKGTSLTLPTAVSSALEKPVKDLPAKIDLPWASVAPTRALKCGFNEYIVPKVRPRLN
jgi:hypothetical protein